MFSKLLLTLMILIGVNSFNLSPCKPTTNFKYVGDTKPANYFDPLLLTSNSPESLIKYVREAELQHGRVSMLSFIFMIASELVDDSKLGINQLSSQSWETQFPFWFLFGVFEFNRMKVGWENPFSKNGKEFKLKHDYQPGNVLEKGTESYTNLQLEQELNNGRLAMIGTLGLIAQELVTQHPIF